MASRMPASAASKAASWSRALPAMRSSSDVDLMADREIRVSTTRKISPVISAAPFWEEGVGVGMMFIAHMAGRRLRTPTVAEYT